MSYVAVAAQGVSSIAKLMGAGINYNNLRYQASSMQNQASSIEVQALEHINQQREQFNQAVGSYLSSATQRGIKTNSGSVERNIELSSKNLGEDFSTIKENTYLQAQSLREQAELTQDAARFGLFTDILGIGANTAMGINQIQSTSTQNLNINNLAK